MRQRALYVSQLQKLEGLLDKLSSDQLSALTTGDYMNLEWWIATPERLEYLMEMIENV
jgi:hypothetical protein